MVILINMNMTYVMMRILTYKKRGAYTMQFTLLDILEVEYQNGVMRLHNTVLDTKVRFRIGRMKNPRAELLNLIYQAKTYYEFRNELEDYCKALQYDLRDGRDRYLESRDVYNGLSFVVPCEVDGIRITSDDYIEELEYITNKIEIELK